MKGTRRYRYIYFQVTYEQENPVATYKELIQAIQKITLELFSKNTKELGLWVVQFDGKTGILKCHYTKKEHTKQLLQALKKIGIKSVTITTHATSGTIHGLLQKKQKHAT